jgi:hypothetical protein
LAHKKVAKVICNVVFSIEKIMADFLQEAKSTGHLGWDSPGFGGKSQWEEAAMPKPG